VDLFVNEAGEAIDNCRSILRSRDRLMWWTTGVMPEPMAICLDVGGTVIDETGIWLGWARWLGVPAATFLAALGASIAIGDSHRRAFEVVRPGIDVDAEIARRDAAGDPDLFGPGDLYPDVRPTLAALRERGHRLIVAGNQPARSSAILRTMGLPVDSIVSSAELGVSKPDPAFFARVCNLAERPAGEIAHVGDRVDNDIVPARACGMTTVLVRRGPWGVLHGPRPDAALADHRIDSLAELVGLSAALGGAGSFEP
jgi:FMN phosphatase YigB (HAD superfamily)